MRIAFIPLLVIGASTAGAQVAAHRSLKALPSSNGRAAIAYDLASARVNMFLEHPYRYPAMGQTTRDFAFDMYPGVRVGSTGTWVTSVTATRTERLTGTGIIHVERTIGGVVVDVYEFAPMTLAEHAAVTLVRVRRASGSGPVDVYQLYNMHMGAGAPEPGSAAEDATWSASRNAFYEWGPSGVTMGYATIGAATHHGVTPQNPFAALLAGADLADNNGPGGAMNDVVCGLQQALGDLPVGGVGWAGFFVVLAADAQAEPAVDRVRAWIAGRTPEQLLAAEQAEWAAWRTPAPAGVTAAERALWDDAQAVLRMGQVREPGRGAGAILASLAPGMWNIAWVRDMAYATAALAASGHLAEARAAIEFQLGARAGLYQQYVGRPYGLSITRYFGNGDEETDFNADGPNIEYDGFGLFLWSIDRWVAAGGEASVAAGWWAAVKEKVADPLLALREPSGLVVADSSIWEVHLNGKQEHFTYTSLTAAAGLCAASRLAGMAGDAAGQASFLAAGRQTANALITRSRSSDGALVQSTEALARGSGFLDAAALEAINLGVIDPSKATARATVAAVKRGLTPPSGRGFMRNDDGGWYDSQEWVFVDLRAALAFARAGDAATASATLAFNVEQAALNDGLFAELHERTTADYAGEVPMVGFGAGAYVLALAERGRAVAAACGEFAAEGGAGGDGGVGADGGASVDAGTGADGGGDDGDDDGCGCRTGGRGRGGAGRGGAAALLGLVLLGYFLLRRSRSGVSSRESSRASLSGLTAKAAGSPSAAPSAARSTR